MSEFPCPFFPGEALMWSLSDGRGTPGITDPAPFGNGAMIH